MTLEEKLTAALTRITNLEARVAAQGATIARNAAAVTPAIVAGARPIIGRLNEIERRIAATAGESAASARAAHLAAAATAGAAAAALARSAEHLVYGAPESREG